MPKQLFTKEYEDYLISGSEESINSLPSGSLEKEYFQIIKQLLKEELTPELEKKIEAFVDKIPEKQSYRLKALHIFKKMKKDPKKKDEIIQEIKDLFKIGKVQNYSKPVKYNKTTDAEKEENESQKLPHELKLEKYIYTDKFIEGIYKGSIIPNNNEYKKKFGNNTIDFNLDFNKIPKDTLILMLTNEKEFSRINNSLPSSFITAKFEYFKEIIKSASEESLKEKKKGYFQKFLSNNKNSLLNEQLEFLISLNSQFNFEKLIPELITRKYPNQIEDKKERVKILKEIKTLLNEYKFKYDKMTRNVLISILELNSEMNIYELDTFIEYIEVPIWDISNMYNITPKIREQIKTNNKQRDLYVQILPINRSKEKILIEKYLKHFFMKEKIPLKDKILSSHEINTLMKEIQLNICDYNKEKFKINENIELNLEIKNIQTLYINIYEINTENYYYSNKAFFDSSISLDGIVPTFEDKISFNEKPQILFEKKISLSKIPKKRGLFVVEFIGNGHVSRAVIQRGNLKCIHKNTVNGKVVYILDEENKILKGEKTGLWINNVWYPSIKETGAVLIPYKIQGNIFILKHDDFCVLEKGIYIPEENYEFIGQLDNSLLMKNHSLWEMLLKF